jgi:hypothetical protein
MPSVVVEILRRFGRERSGDRSVGRTRLLSSTDNIKVLAVIFKVDHILTADLIVSY